MVASDYRISVREASKRLGISTRQILYYIKMGQLRAEQLNPGLETSPFLISVSDWDRFEREYRRKNKT